MFYLQSIVPASDKRGEWLAIDVSQSLVHQATAPLSLTLNRTFRSQCVIANASNWRVAFVKMHSSPNNVPGMNTRPWVKATPRATMKLSEAKVRQRGVNSARCELPHYISTHTLSAICPFAKMFSIMSNEDAESESSNWFKNLICSCFSSFSQWNCCAATSQSLRCCSAST